VYSMEGLKKERKRNKTEEQIWFKTTEKWKR
jgi:hypothetical protein